MYITQFVRQLITDHMSFRGHTDTSGYGRKIWRHTDGSSSLPQETWSDERIFLAPLFLQTGHHDYCLRKGGIWGPELGIDGYVRLLADTSGNQVQEWSEWKGFWRGWGDVHTISHSNLDLIASWTFPSNILHDSFCFCASQNKTIAFLLVRNAKKSAKSLSPLGKNPMASPTQSINSIQQVSYPIFFPFSAPFEARAS